MHGDAEVKKTAMNPKSYNCSVTELGFEPNYLTPTASLVAQLVKKPPANAGDAASSLSQEDPFEKETAAHSSILDWKIPGTEEPGGLQPMGLQRVGHDLVTK